MKSAKVSVHILSYNHEKYIEKCLLSALEQNYDNLEVVVGDDGSTDRTVEIINELALQYPKRLIPIVNCGHLGITGNANRVLSKCTGEFIAITGGDDYFLPGKIEKQVEWMQLNPRAVLCGHKVLIQQGNEVAKGAGYDFLNEVNFGFAGSLIQLGPPFPTLSIMYRSQDIPDYGFDVRGGLVSDWKLFLDVVQDKGCFGFLSDELSVYRKHENSTTLRKKIEIVEDVEKVLNLIKTSYADQELLLIIAKAEKSAILWKCTEYHKEGLYSSAMDSLLKLKELEGLSIKELVRYMFYKLNIPYSWLMKIKE